MNHQQFCQVVLLPQGDFAQFLRADAETRKRLLERLFGTERFSAVEGWLVDRRRERGQELGSVDREIEGTIARLAEASDDPAPPEPADAELVSAWAHAQLANLDAALAAARATLATTRTARSAADHRLAAERALAERQERLTSLRARAAALDAAAGRVDQARLELAAAGRTGGIALLLDAVTVATETAAARRTDAQAAIRTAAARTADSRVAATVADLDRRGPSTQTASALEAVERDVRAEVTRLEALLSDEERLLELGAELEAAETEVADLEADRTSHQSWLATMPERAAALEARRDLLVGLVRDEPAQRAEHAGARGRHRGCVAT